MVEQGSNRAGAPALPPPPPADASLDQLWEYNGRLEDYAIWANRELGACTEKLVDLQHRLFSQEKDLAEARKKVVAYETVLASRARVAAYEPGTEVRLVNADNQAAIILDVRISRGNVVSYRVGWWVRGGQDGWNWREAVLLDDQVIAELPLVLPPMFPRRVPEDTNSPF
jgi:hypothetical protein